MDRSPKLLPPRARAAFVLLLAAVLPGIAHAGVTRLMAPESRATADLRGYDSVVVLAPEAALEKAPKDAAAAAKLAAQLDARANELADNLAARLRASGGFSEVSRSRSRSDAHDLVVRGRILKFRDANVLQRAVGLFQGARLRLDVEVVDGATDRLLARSEVDFSGGLEPGSWTSLIENMDGFINGAAARLHDELLVAGGFRQREQIGRAARGREKYLRD